FSLVSVLLFSGIVFFFFFFFQAEDGIRDRTVTGVQTCALPIFRLRTIGIGNGSRDVGRHGGGRCSLLRQGGRGVGKQRGGRNGRSEERRVGKEWRGGWGREEEKERKEEVKEGEVMKQIQRCVER